MMELERWQHIEEIFHEALALLPEEREAYVSRVCGSDEALLNEVKSLVVSYDGRAEFLEKGQMTAGLSLLARSAEKIRTGTEIAHYVLQKRIGRGGMGDVYLAKDKRLGRKIALKLLIPSFIDDLDWISRFQREARAASSIAHPNIAHIYEFGQEDGHHYIAMEYIEGVTLRERIKDGPLKLKEAIEIAIQIARALVVAHATELLHRDIKPDNVMIHQGGYVKILDFGIAKWTQAHEHDSRVTSAFDTAEGVVVGSPAYMSPEQARGLEVDQRSDLWSLGIVLYELLTGINPFLLATRSDTIAAILRSDAAPLRELCPNLPPELERIITKLLSKDRNDRYPSAEALISDVEALNENLKYGQPAEVDARESSRATVAVTTKRNIQRASRPSSISVKSVPAYLLGVASVSKTRIVVLIAIAGIIVLALKYGSHLTRPAASAPITSIAVLPLVNQSGNPATDYLAQGLSESLIERFSKIPRLKVISRDSSFKYKGSEARNSVAEALGVQAIVVGTMTQDEDGLQINLELVDARQSVRLWSGQYAYDLTKFPTALNDICQAIGSQLDVSADELKLLAQQQTPAGTAYDRYLTGRFLWSQFSEESLDKSIEAFNEALAIDPRYALAYTGLANSYVVLGANYRSPAVELPKAQQAAQRALAIDEGLAEAHYAIAVTKYLTTWDLVSTEAELKRALQLNPNYALANSLLCSVSLTRGDTKQALVYIKRALELDPLSLLFNTHLSYTYYCLRENDLAIKQLQSLLKLDANASFVYNDLARVYAQAGRFSDALSASQRATVLLGQDPNTLTSLGIVYGLSGKTNEARWVAGTLERLSGTKHVQPYLIASIYSASGDKDQAFAWLTKANAERSPQMLRLRVDPVFDKLRSDSRYTQLLKATGFI